MSKDRYDIDGNPISLEKLVVIEPMWAVSRIRKLENDIRVMVQKAADESLEGYRELGRRAAAAENECDKLRVENKRFRVLLENHGLN